MHRSDGLDRLRGTLTTLDGGLRVVVVPMPAVHRVVMEASLRIGSRYEPSALNGISHFLEHMLFRGTPRFPSAHELILEVERLGGSLNAATSVDHGVLTLETPPDTFADLVPVFAETYRSPLLADLETERGIVREEILESLDDGERQIDPDNLSRETCFAGHPLGMPITGTLEHLERFAREGLLAHHRAHYTAENTVLTIAGPVDPDATLRLVEAHFSGLPRGLPPGVAPPPQQTAPRFRYVHHTASSQTSVRVAFRAPAENTPGAAATDLLSRVLDDGMATRLYHRICDLKGLAYNVSATYEAYADAGLLELGTDVAHERVPELMRELHAVIRELREAGPTPDEVAKAKARFRWQLIEILDSPTDVAELYGLEHLTGSLRTPTQRLAELESLRDAELGAAAQTLFDRAGLSVVAVGILPTIVQRELADLVAAF